MLRAGLNYGEEVHHSRISGEWSNMIGFGMNSSLAKVYTTPKTFAEENSKHGWKNDMVVNMATFFVREVLQRSSLLNNLKLSDKKLDL
jgi:hypothetical protein